MKTGSSGPCQRATSHRVRAQGQRCALVLALAGVGCQAVEPTPTLQASSALAAEGLVRELLDAATAKTAPRALCDGSGAGQARAAAAIGIIQSYRIDHVEPAWVGAEPHFRVDVTLQRAVGEERRSVAVRARQGCVERLWGAPLPTAIRPEPDELSL